MPVIMKTKGGKSVNSMAGLLGVFQKDFGEDIGNFGGTLVNSDRLPTSIFPLDLALAGGLPHGKVSVIYGPESSGKCHAAGTKILMFDGSLKNVEDIRTGDKAMGVDSTPRTVTGAGKGYGPLFRISPVKGADSFVVNGEHVLSLVCTHNQGYRRKGDIVNISVNDWMAKSDDWKIYHHLYRVGVEFPEKDLPLDPYWLGLWLGDGASRVSAITTTDAEIVDFLQEHADRNRWRLAVYLAEGRCPSYATVGDVRGTMRARPVVPLDWLQRLGLIQNKHIPAIYKTGGRQQRLRLLAGLLDSDGCKGSGSSVYFSNTNERLVQDVVFLARSLGLYASVTKWLSTCNGKKFPALSVYLAGDFSEVPYRLERKVPKKRRRAGSPLTSRFAVEPAGEGGFFGFTLDGDHLYMLDTFIVNHNTNIALMTIAAHQLMFPDKVCVFFDIENSFDPAWARLLGVDTTKLVVIRPSYGEQVVDMAESALYTDDCGIVVIDSLAALLTTSELQASAERSNVGGSTLLIGKLVRKTTLALSEADKKGRQPTLIYINQVRSKVGVVYGNPETMPGGNAPKFQANIILRVYGKNEMDAKVSSTMPVKKEVKFVISKWKCPILSAGGTFSMATLPHQGLKVGQCADFNTVSEYLKSFGQFEKDAKKGWVILGQHYPVIDEFKTRLYNDPAFGASVRKQIIDKMAQAGDLLQSQDDDATEDEGV